MKVSNGIIAIFGINPLNDDGVTVGLVVDFDDNSLKTRTIANFVGLNEVANAESVSHCWGIPS